MAIIQLNEKAIAVEIPVKSNSYYILDSANGKGQGLFWKETGNENPSWEILPPGSWTILGRPWQLSEEQCIKIVPEYVHVCDNGHN